MQKQVAAVEQLRNHRAETAIILDFGLSSLVADAKSETTIPYAEFSSIPQPSVPGHKGQFLLGTIDTTRVIFAQGRVHLTKDLLHAT